MVSFWKWKRHSRQRLQAAKQSLTMVDVREQRVRKTLAEVDEILERNGLGEKAAAALGLPMERW